MKQPELIVQIPEPCHENWNKMSPTEKGKFCQVCTKEVVDFTSKSDEELIKHFTTNGNLCGRFHASQLNRKLIADRKKRNHWLSYAATLLLPMTLFSQEKKSDSKKTAKTEQLDSLQFKTLHISSLNRKAKVHSKKQQDSITIIGTITDDTKMPLPGATIKIKGSKKEKSTDFDGNFSLKASIGNILMISYPGYETTETSVKASKNDYKIQLKLGEALEEVIIVGYGVKRVLCNGIETVDSKEIKTKKKITKNYFQMQKKKWKEKREKRRAKRKARKAEKQAKND